MNKSVKSKMQVYTEEIWNEAYSAGYEAGSIETVKNGGGIEQYEKGLNDAWECAREICNFRTPEEWVDFYKFMDVSDYIAVFNKYSASEVITKLKEYNKRKQSHDNKIKVGDEVLATYSKIRRVVTSVWRVDDTIMVTQVTSNGFWYSDDAEKLRKTGRHFPQIAEVLKQMKKAEKEVEE